MTVQPNDLGAEIFDLKRRLRDLETGLRLGNTTLSQGQLILDGGDIEIVDGAIYVQGDGRIVVDGGVFTNPGGYLFSESNDGDIVYVTNGRVLFQDNGSGEYGGIYSDVSRGANSLFVYPPHDGALITTYLSLNGASNSSGSLGVAQLVGKEAVSIVTDGTAGVSGKQATNVQSEVQTTVSAPVVSLNCGNGGRVAPYGLQGTSAAANVNLSGDVNTWSFRLVGSSKRFKQDIEPAEIDPKAVLSLTPSTWTDKHQASYMGDDAPRHVGIIAEEVVAAGLGQFATDEDGNPMVSDTTGDPYGLQYDRLGTAGLLAVAKYHEDRADKAEEELAAANKKLDTITAYLQSKDPDFALD